MAEPVRPDDPTIADLLIEHARHRDRVFLVTGRGVTTYAQQLDRARRVASALHALGARPGDRVHVQVSNSAAFYDLWFAAALTDSVLVPTSPQLTSDEIAHVYSDAEPSISVVESASLRAAQHAWDAGTPRTRPRVIDVVEVLRRAAGSPLAPIAPGNADLTAAILYTSGTTSRPKGVMLTGANYVAVGQAVAEHLAVRSDDRWLVTLPLFHANAQYYCTMSALVAGASVALTDRFSASGWGRQARELQATLASLFAAPIRMILAKPPTSEDSNNRIRTVLYAQNISTAQAREFEARFDTRLVQLYGMTETVLPPTINPPDERRRWDSIGQPLRGVELRLVAEDGTDATDIGELWVRGAAGRSFASGYWRDPVATSTTFTGAWLRTGDLARRDGDGFFYFVDRTKDMIKRAGENISAGEIERVANEHDGVLESAAIGLPDPMLDQAVVLVVVRQPGSTLTVEELTAWCTSRLSAYKVPSAVKFIEALPRTSVGKIRKDQVHRELLMELPR